MNISGKYGQLYNSFGYWIWSIKTADKTPDDIFSICFDTEKMMTLFDRAVEFGIKSNEFDAIHLVSNIKSKSYDDAEIILCKIISKMYKIKDDDIISQQAIVFSMENKWFWVSALDWFSLYRSTFSYYKISFPFHGIVLVDTNTISKKLFPDGSYIDETNSVAFRLDDVLAVWGEGAHINIILNDRSIILLDWKNGLTAHQKNETS